MSVPAERLTQSAGSSPSMRLKVGDHAVSPAHGVAEVVAVERRDLGGSAQEFYVLCVADTGIRLTVPVGAADHAAIRPLMDRKEAGAVLRVLKTRRAARSQVPWARRSRAYQKMLYSGSPLDVARVLADLARLRRRKELSFGERKLFDAARRLLVKEVALSCGETEAQVERRFERALGAPIG